MNKYIFFFNTRAIIDYENYSEFKDIEQSNLKCDFGLNNFKLVISPPDSLNTYVFDMQRTRENIISEKCKYYIRKRKIYVALYKEV